MTMKTSLLFTTLLATVLLAACDSGDPGDFVTEYVVESYLIAGEPLTSVHLSRTAPINQTYDFTALAIREATMRLDLLADDGWLMGVVRLKCTDGNGSPAIR